MNRWTFRTNLKAAGLAKLVLLVTSTVLLVGIILAALHFGFVQGENDWLILPVMAVAAVPFFVAGYVASLLGEDRGAVWILIVMLFGAMLLFGSSSLPVNPVQPGDSLFTVLQKVFLAWILGAIPVFAGARLQERRSARKRAAARSQA